MTTLSSRKNAHGSDGMIDILVMRHQQVCHVTRRVSRASYSSEKTQKHLQTTLVSDSIVSLVISMGNNRYVSLRYFIVLLRLMSSVGMTERRLRERPKTNGSQNAVRVNGVHF